MMGRGEDFGRGLPKGDFRVKKSNRILELFFRLMRGEKVNKRNFAENNNIDLRSVERDVGNVREMLSEVQPYVTLEIDSDGNYYLDHWQQKEFTAQEVLYISKVLLSSRSLTKEEMTQVIYAMNSLFPPNVRTELKAAVQNELFQYVEPLHGRELLELHWDLATAVRKQLKVKLTYRKLSGEVVTRTVLPIAVVSSEFYLYFVGFFEEKEYNYPAFFRLDRIEKVEITAEKSYNRKLMSSYNMGKMKHCIQFMFAGELLKIKLACTVKAREAVLDRLPNHKIIAEEDGRTIISAEVFGEGFCLWVMQYGTDVEVLEPAKLRETIKERAKKIYEMYEKDE